MRELELTWQRLLSIWWAAAWRSCIGFLLIMGIAALVGLAWRSTGWPEGNARLVGQIVGAIGSLVIGFVVLRMMLLNRYRDFRIALIPREPDAPITP
jgi:hypothetical protein